MFDRGTIGSAASPKIRYSFTKPPINSNLPFSDFDTSTNQRAVQCSLIFFFFFFLTLYHFPASGQAVVTGVIPSSPRFLPSIFIAHRVQQSHCSSIFHRVLLTHALALSARQLCARHVRHIRYFFHGPMHMTKSKKAKSLSRDAQPLARGPLESPRIMTS